MSIDLNEFIAEFVCAQKSQRVRDTLEHSFTEAQRVMSPNGIRTYLDGASALCNSGKGDDVIVTFLEEMPEVVREIGEEAVGETVLVALKLSSQTSGSVIALLLASLPTAARRLGDIAVFKGYLNLIERMVSLAPRGLRPMLDHVDELLTKLTLGRQQAGTAYLRYDIALAGTDLCVIGERLLVPLAFLGNLPKEKISVAFIRNLKRQKMPELRFG